MPLTHAPEIFTHFNASGCKFLCKLGAEWSSVFQCKKFAEEKKTFATKHARRTGFLWEAAFASFLYNFIERVSAESLSQSP